ncbi:MAG: sigma-70 family RNA polymerase sigma factor [Thermodesulfobacteriota bacterium]
MPENKKRPQIECLLTFEGALTKILDCLYTTASELTRDKREAEDRIIEECLKEFQSLYQRRTRSKAKAWLYRMLIQTVLNKYRKDLKKTGTVDADVEKLFLESLQECSERLRIRDSNALSKIFDREIEGALCELLVELRTVVWLSDVAGFSQSEISFMLDCPISTVASRLHRGRKFLRHTLSEYAGQWEIKRE